MQKLAASATGMYSACLVSCPEGTKIRQRPRRSRKGRRRLPVIPDVRTRRTAGGLHFIICRIGEARALNYLERDEARLQRSKKLPRRQESERPTCRTSPGKWF
ncbi:hypothetical protein EMEDMD4_70036 [Sinorhizobium medicae]|uniref:Uncharacterized protein n=1 Tax=Sinorhizobium medicae TaxID=110321 RepID=A0A508X9U5_9HYPH|nr:hypothetical protein EMEDMD4_70036 [Sinorhizobium medicae]